MRPSPTPTLDRSGRGAAVASSMHARPCAHVTSLVGSCAGRPGLLTMARARPRQAHAAQAAPVTPLRMTCAARDGGRLMRGLARGAQGGEARFCSKCGRHKPPRAHHCRLCRRCVLRMDHHCPWRAAPSPCGPAAGPAVPAGGCRLSGRGPGRRSAPGPRTRCARRVAPPDAPAGLL